MEFLAHPWQLALLCFAAGFLLARWIYHRGEVAVPLRTDISDAEIEAAIRTNHKIDAIRLYRQRTGAGLKDARQAVETIAHRIDPADFHSSAK